MPGSTPSRQCRRPAPSAPCSRAQAPRAGGLGAAFRVGWGGGGSRRRQAHEQGPAACGALGDAALPFGQGALPVCGVDAVCPAGKGAAEWRAGSWRVAGKAGFWNVLPIRGLYRRAGERGNGPHPTGDGDTRHLADRTRPSPGKTFHIILPPQTRRSTRHASCPSRKTSPARAQDQRSAPVYDPSAPVYGPFRAIYDLPTPFAVFSCP